MPPPLARLTACKGAGSPLGWSGRQADCNKETREPGTTDTLFPTSRTSHKHRKKQGTSPIRGAPGLMA